MARSSEESAGLLRLRAAGRRIAPYVFSVAPLRGIVLAVLISLAVSAFFVTCVCLEYSERAWLKDTRVGEFLRFLKLIELKSLDLRFLLRKNITPGDQVIIIALDDETLNQLKSYPLPRGCYARLVDRLAEAGAKVIAFDVLFAEPQNKEVLDRVGKDVADYKKSHPNAPKDDPVLRLLEDQRQSFDEDAKLAAAFRRALEKNVYIVTAVHFEVAGEKKTEGDSAPKLSVDDPSYRLLVESAYFLKNPVNLGTGRHAGPYASLKSFISPKIPPGHVQSATNVIYPLAETSAAMGFVDYAMDTDGVVRSEFLVREFNNDLFPPLGVQALIWYLDLYHKKDLVLNFWGTPAKTENPKDVVLKFCEGIKLGDREIPIERDGRMFINFRGPRGTFPTYSLVRVMNGQIEPSRLKDKLVLVGATAEGTGDFFVTPHSGHLPGVEKHANAIDCILQKDFIVRDFGTVLTDLLIVLGLALVVGLLLTFLTATAGLCVTILFIMLTGWYCQHAFAQHQPPTWHNMTYPLLTIISTFSLVALYRFATEARRKREVKQVFERYMQASVVTEVLRHTENIQLGGDVREITVFFSDLAGFSTISEKLTPQAVITFLNQCYDEMAPAILQRNAFLDKFWGDAIVAAFGVPIQQKDHAVQACLAALDCQERLARLNERMEREGRPLALARIGLHSGSAVVGNVGSRQAKRFNYTALGDAVNVGARLESANKDFQTNILISSATYELAQYAVEARELGRILVKGRKEAVPVYELLGEMNKTPGHKLVLADIFHHGLQLYLKRDWDGATFAFQKALAHSPNDGPSLVYLRACKAFREAPPPNDWDGILVMKEGKD